MPPKHRHRRYKLLLDENVETRKYFPILNSRHNVKHIAEDLKQSSITDTAVYALAKKEKRLIITYNDKDFYALSEQSKDTGVIGVSKNLTPEQNDKKVHALLARKSKGELYGHFNQVSGEAVKH